MRSRRRGVPKGAEYLFRVPFWLRVARVPSWLRLAIGAIATASAAAAALVNPILGVLAAVLVFVLYGLMEQAVARAERAELQAELRRPRTPSIREAEEQLRVQQRILTAMNAGRGPQL
jgi:hypothetical protein